MGINIVCNQYRVKLAVNFPKIINTLSGRSRTSVKCWRDNAHEQENQGNNFMRTEVQYVVDTTFFKTVQKRLNFCGQNLQKPTLKKRLLCILDSTTMETSDHVGHEAWLTFVLSQQYLSPQPVLHDYSTSIMVVVMHAYFNNKIYCGAERESQEYQNHTFAFPGGRYDATSYRAFDYQQHLCS